RLFAYAGFLLGLPELDGDLEGGHREHAAPLHPRGAGSPRRLKRAETSFRRAAVARPALVHPLLLARLLLVLALSATVGPPPAGAAKHEPDMTKIIDDAALDQLFRAARTHNKWQAKPVSDTLLKAVWELAKMGPTSANCSPARILFVKSPEAKERLEPAPPAGNLPKTMEAPVTAVIGYDREFYEKLAFLFPHNLEARSWFAGKPEVIETNAFRNGSLQGAYLILAARALGLDCGPM